MSLFNNKYYKTSEKPRRLVIFIHGYNGTPEAIDYAVQDLCGKLTDSVVVVPRAPFTCEKNADNLQWLSFYKVDPLAKFRAAETSVSDIFDIFNRLGDDFALVARQMNAFIDEQQKIWQLTDRQTFLVGFSQGAMISIYTALTRKGVLGGCVPVAGIIPGQDRLVREIVSRPKFLVLHGRDDATVQYKTLAQSLDWLKAQDVPFQVLEFDNLAHRMNEAEMQATADFINV